MSQDKKTIDEFMAYYKHAIDHYREACRLCAERCERLLRANGIRAITTSRAKHVDRLREKLLERNEMTRYETLDSIRGDIADLAGVRLALYFPNDRAEVARLLTETFDVSRKKVFPREEDKVPPRVFSGYGADHYRLTLRSSDLPEDKKQYAETKIEVQVASVLMHAWSEVEPLSANISGTARPKKFSVEGE